MRIEIVIVLVASTLWMPPVIAAQEVDRKSNIPLQDELREIKRDTVNLKDSVEILRRDQINYKIEKDLLKEAFASNLQTINIILALVLGVFAVLSYLGFKGILSIKSEYSKELEVLRQLKLSLETEIQAVIKEQKTVKEEIVKIAQVNEEQEKKFKILEFKEKTSQLLDTRKFGLALEFADAGLLLDPKNVILLQAKALCHIKFAQFDSALGTWKTVLEVSPENAYAIENSAEAFLLTEKVDEFDKWYARYQEIIDRARNGVTAIYFKTLRGMVTNDTESIKAVLLPYVLKSGSGAVPRMGSWGFDEVRRYMRKLPNGPLKDLRAKVIDFFEGKTPTEELKAILEKKVI